MTPTATTDDVTSLLAWIVERLRTEYAPQKIILFGSYAYGTPQPDSDIDLLIIKETGDRFLDRWVRVRHLLSDSERTIPLEPLIMTPQEVTQRLARGDQFLAEILEKGRILYAAA
jgi:predicted nucleotidyltransferase